MAAAGIFDAVLVGFGVKSVKAFSEAQAITAQLNQVLLTTGKNATLSTEQVHKLAMSLEEYSGQTHDAIEQGQTILLQFSGITKDTLPQASKAMVDLAQRMGIDTVTAAKSLGIALDDPEVGMSRLRRAGIDFTADQKAAIKALKESGDTAGAAALLMQVLETKVGGAAGAYRNTLAGAVSEAKDKLKDFEIEVGQKIVTALQDAYTWYENHKRILNDLAGVLGTLVGVLGTLLFLYGNWILLTKALTIAQGILNALFLSNPIIAAITAILVIAALIYEHWNRIKDILRPVFDFFDKYINPIIDKLGKLVKEQLIIAWDNLRDSFEKAMQTLKPFYPQLKLIGEMLGVALITPLVLVAAGIAAVIVGIVALGVFLARLIGWIAEVVAAVIKWQVSFVTTIANVYISITNEGNKIVAWFVALPGIILSITNNAINWLYNTGSNIIHGLINGLTGALGSLIYWIASISSTVVNALGNAGDWLYQKGKDIINGLVRGIKDAIGGIGSAIGSVGSSISSAVSGALHSVHIPGFASGVQNFAGGLAMVGENGPELVNLPAGSNVIPNNQLQGAGSITTNINGTINIGSEVDATNFLKRLTQNQELAMKGLTPVR